VGHRQGKESPMTLVAEVLRLTSSSIGFDREELAALAG
jgi:hypothetical protein